MGGSSLAELYGPSDLMRFIWTVVVGVGALVVGQSRFVSEFPPSTADAVPLPPRGTAFSGPCFAVAGIGGEVVGSLFMKASLPLWVGGGPVRARWGGSSLAELYGPSNLMRFIWTAVVGLGDEVGTQSN